MGMTGALNLPSVLLVEEDDTTRVSMSISNNTTSTLLSLSRTTAMKVQVAHGFEQTILVHGNHRIHHRSHAVHIHPDGSISTVLTLDCQSDENCTLSLPFGGSQSAPSECNDCVGFAVDIPESHLAKFMQARYDDKLN